MDALRLGKSHCTAEEKEVQRVCGGFGISVFADDVVICFAADCGVVERDCFRVAGSTAEDGVIAIGAGWVDIGGVSRELR